MCCFFLSIHSSYLVLFQSVNTKPKGICIWKTPSHCQSRLKIARLKSSAYISIFIRLAQFAKTKTKQKKQKKSCEIMPKRSETYPWAKIRSSFRFKNKTQHSNKENEQYFSN